MQSDPYQLAEMKAAQELVARDLHCELIERASAAILALDAESLRIFAANAAARQMLGLTMRDLAALRLDQILYRIPQERLKALAAMLRRRAGGNLRALVRSDPRGRNHFAVAVQHFDRKDPCFVLHIQDESHQVRTRIEASESRRQLITAIESLSDGFVLYDRDDRMVVCNQTYRDIYAISAPAMVPGTPFETILRYGAERGQYADAEGRIDEWVVERLIAHNALQDDLEQELSDGRWLRIVERETPDGGRVGLRVDITALKRQQSELKRLLRTDDLTGLRNRRLLAEDIADLVADLPAGRRFAILHLDLDRFKNVNEVFGHAAGDHVLRTCADRIRTEEVGAVIAARVGGDEFLCLVEVPTEGTTHVAQAQLLIDLVNQPIRFAGRNCWLGACVGIAFAETGTAEACRDALAAADIALAEAKAGGTGSVVVFRADMREQLIRNNQIARDMIDGLSRGEFCPHFQPQVNATTGQVVGFEALIRWQPEGRPPVPAGEFLAVAQSAGLTTAIDDIVMMESCRAIHILREWGMTQPHVSINLSLDQISDPRLLSRLHACLDKWEVRPENLRIELLESTLLDDRSSVVLRNVRDLIAAGFLMELDDFGTGHAAIATLRKFDVSQIKIDRSFVRNIDKDAGLQAMTGAIIDLARKLGVSALAEGVETEEEQKVLLDFGCPTAQGYLHARPMPLEDLRSFLDARGALRTA